jgi:chemotaxis protein MotB
MIKESLAIEDLMALLEKPIQGEIRISSEEEREIIIISGKILFPEDSLNLISSSYPLLDKLSRFIKKGNYPVQIVGHTDNRPGEEKGYHSNWELSALMALEVLKYLTGKGGIPPERLAAYGCGGFRPIASNESRISRAQNNRVEIVLNFKAPAFIRRIYGKKPSGFFTYKKFDFRIF